MQALRQRTVSRLLSTSSLRRPWFVDPDHPSFPTKMAPHLAPPPSHQLLPSDLPHQIRQLYAKLSQSPLIEPAFLDVRQPIAPPPGPPLPKRPVLGRRGRGRTYSGEGIDQDHGGIWNWVVTAQVSRVTPSTRTRRFIDSLGFSRSRTGQKIAGRSKPWCDWSG